VTASAKEALAALERSVNYDVAVTDIEMPEMDGYALAEAIRANPRTAHLPVLALSSTLNAGLIARSERAGMRSFIAKFDRRGLLQTLKNIAAEWQEAA